MRLFPVLFLTVFAASSLAAQNVDVFVRAIDATKEGTTHVHGGAAVVGLDDATGFEIGADLFWSPRISTELSVSSVRHELDASAFGETVDLGSTRVMPVTAVFELHSGPRGKLDFHIGAGASYVTFEKLEDNAQLTLLGVRSIEFHNKVAPVADAGASWRIGSRWAINADAKWTDIKTDTSATYLDGTSEGATLNLRQVTLGAGLSMRF